MAPEDPPALEDVYDDDILARIDRVTGWRAEAPAAASVDEPGGEPSPADAEGPAEVRYPRARRLGVSGAMVAGSMMGLGDVLEPEKARQHMIEFTPDMPDENTQRVTFHLVPGNPRASRIVVRPWIRERFAGRRA